MSIIPPAGSEPSKDFPGFTGDRFSIIVSEFSSPLTHDIEKKGEEGGTVLHKERISLQGLDGLLIETKQLLDGKEMCEWVLLFGDSSGSVSVIASLPSSEEQKLSPGLKEALLTSRWEKNQPIDVREGLDFAIAEKGGLRVSSRYLNFLVFSKLGLSEDTVGANPVLVAGKNSLTGVKENEKEALAKSVILESQYVVAARFEHVERIKIDGLPGYEIIARGKLKNSGLSIVIYLVTLFLDDKYYTLMGRVVASYEREYLSVFREMAGSFHRISAPEAAPVETDDLLAEFNPSSIVWKSVTASADCKRIAFVELSSKGVCLVSNGHAGRLYDAVDTLAFSVDGRHLFYKAFDHGQWIVVTDDKEGDRYDYVGSLVISPGGERLAYLAGVSGRTFWVIDGEEGRNFDSFAADTIIFTPDGNHYAYSGNVLRVMGKDEGMVVFDGKDSKAYDSVDHPVLSNDGNRIAYEAQVGGKWCLVVDGRESRMYDNTGYSPVFSSDGNRLAYAIWDEDHMKMVVDGKEGKAYRYVTQPIFSPSGKHVAYAVVVNEKAGVVVDGEEGSLFDGVLTPTLVFSPNSDRFAYVATRAGKAVVVVDGRESESYDDILEDGIRFSPDSRHVAYGVFKDGKYFVVLDGVRQKRFDSIGNRSLTFSLDSRRFAYTASDGSRKFVVEGDHEHKSYDGFVLNGRLFFSPDSKLLLYAAIKGECVFMVVEENEGLCRQSILGSGVVFDKVDSFHYVAVADNKFVMGTKKINGTH